MIHRGLCVFCVVPEARHKVWHTFSLVIPSVGLLCAVKYLAVHQCVCRFPSDLVTLVKLEENDRVCCRAPHDVLGLYMPLVVVTNRPACPGMLPTFDCSSPPSVGVSIISHEVGHINMASSTRPVYTCATGETRWRSWRRPCPRALDLIQLRSKPSTASL